MAKATRIDLARAGKEELLDYLEKAGISLEGELPIAQLREKALEVQQTISAARQDDDLEARAKAAGAKIIEEAGLEDEESDESPLESLGIKRSAPKTFEMDSLEVHPEDGEADSINAIIDNSRKSGDEMETVEERILKEQARKKDDFRTAKLVAVADAEINEYHRAASQKHKAKLTNICFFLKKGMFLSSVTTPYTKIQGVRLRKETPYRSLDIELKFFRSRRGMFGECAYSGADLVPVKGKK